MTIEREEFGAKSANLAAIAPLISEIDTADVAGVVGIPDFEAVSVALHERWLSRDITDAEVMELFNRAQELSKTGDGLMVRSSAVLGEDGETSMGAGVYESERLNPDFSLLDFHAALKAVYESIRSPKATAYLEQLGINPDDERMGILLQTYPKHVQTHFTLDTTLAGNPELISVRTENLTIDGDKYVDNRKEVGLLRSKYGYAVLDRKRVSEINRLNTTLHWDHLDDVYHIVPDKRKFNTTHSPVALAKVALSVEEFIGSSVQVEAVDSRKIGLNERDGARRLWIVQNRPLVRGVETSEHFDGFPESDETPAFLGRGVGVLNGIVVRQNQETVLGSDFSSEQYATELKSLPEGEGQLLMFVESFSNARASDQLTKNLLELPEEVRKKVVVLVKTSSKPGLYSGARGGHFETMCLELGIPCVFFEPNIDDRADSYSGIYISDLDQRYKIFSDGYQARVYRV